MPVSWNICMLECMHPEMHAAAPSLAVNTTESLLKSPTQQPQIPSHHVHTTVPPEHPILSTVPSVHLMPSVVHPASPLLRSPLAAPPPSMPPRLNASGNKCYHGVIDKTDAVM